MAVVTLRKPEQTEIVYDDPIFFHKSQVAVGTQLRNVGRRDPTARWVIKKIATFQRIQKTDRFRLVPVDSVVHLSDQIFMQNTATGETRQLSFAGISYSAIWRIA
jgi:hypothetical protein